ncbi:hypothetical protein [Alkanindiges illinoisensis]|uniref:hypothetical protein n=1 Tax=Alkanindiges illinoisensis TaxID=197183 RepID=UPI00047DA979|nr:hypothetical protein [Alkanindiges illinoisensis]
MKNYISYLPFENIKNIPSKHISSYEYIFFLHDQCAKLLIEYGSSNIDEVGLDELIEAYSINFKNNDFDIVEVLQFFKEKSIDAPYFHFLYSKILLGLTGDLLNFIYESLKCFEKRKFSVAYSLLRKPLKENLTFICWLFNNYENFIEKFEQETDKTLNKIHESTIKSIILETINKLPLPELFDAELLYNMIFSKQHLFGLEIPCQRSTHLITSHGSHLKTGKMFINSIFDNPNETGQYQPLYISLPYIMLFTSHVIFEAFNKIIRLNNKTHQHFTLTSIASYENLYSDARKRPLTKWCGKAIKEFLKCIYCNKTINLTKENSLRMFMTDKLICNHCHTHLDFPFYWLLAQTKISITSTNSDDDSAWKDTILARMFKSTEI